MTEEEYDEKEIPYLSPGLPMGKVKIQPLTNTWAGSTTSNAFTLCDSASSVAFSADALGLK